MKYLWRKPAGPSRPPQRRRTGHSLCPNHPAGQPLRDRGTRPHSYPLSAPHCGRSEVGRAAPFRDAASIFHGCIDVPGTDQRGRKLLDLSSEPEIAGLPSAFGDLEYFCPQIRNIQKFSRPSYDLNDWGRNNERAGLRVHVGDGVMDVKFDREGTADPRGDPIVNIIIAARPTKSAWVESKNKTFPEPIKLVIDERRHQ